MKIKDFWIFFKNSFCLSQIITLVKIKDFWILFYFLKFSNFHTMELKDFWIFSNQNFFPRFSHLRRSRIFGFFFIFWNFTTFLQLEFKDPWIFSKGIFFSRFSDMWRSSMIFLFPQIFKLQHNGIKGFLDFFKTDFWIFFIFWNFQTFTQLEFKDFLIFSKRICFSRISDLWRSRTFGFFLFPDIFKLSHIGIKGFLDFFKT